MITKDQIQKLRDTQSPITGNCAYLCALALGEHEHPEISREEAIQRCEEIALRVDQQRTVGRRAMETPPDQRQAAAAQAERVPPDRAPPAPAPAPDRSPASRGANTT